jgi:putative SOS response-associated peptidase YedK
MCGRFFRHGVTWAEYHAALSLIPPEGVESPEAAYNIAPTQYAPIIRLTPEGEAADRGHDPDGAGHVGPRAQLVAPAA